MYSESFDGLMNVKGHAIPQIWTHADEAPKLVCPIGEWSQLDSLTGDWIRFAVSKLRDRANCKS